MKHKTVVNRLFRTIVVSFLIILICCLIALFLIPIPPLEDSVSPEKLADTDSRFVSIQDVAVHYKVAGSGNETLILLHGFGASTFTWHKVVTPLAQNHTVIIYDRTGFGYTSRPLPGEWQGDNPYSQKSQVEQLVVLMDTLKIDNAVLIGSSAGGMTAALTAVYYPTRVKALVLVAAAIFQGGPPQWVNTLVHIPPIKRLGPLLIRKYYTTFFEQGRNRAWHDPSKQTLEILEGYRKPMKANNWDRALWEYLSTYETLNIGERLSEIEVPVLVITGDDDRIVPQGTSEKIAGRISQAELVTIPETGHLPHEETPEVFLKIVNAFLEKVL